MKKLIIIVICLFSIQCEKGWLNKIISPKLEGCMDSAACNYNSEAEEDDGSCIAKQGCNEWCEGDSLGIQEYDCNGVCGGVAKIDDCGECSGGNTNDEFNHWKDCNGDCHPDSAVSCNHQENQLCGQAYVDACGDCVGGNTGMETGDVDDDGICDSDETTQTDCSNPNTCSNCTGCESSCCPNYCSGNYYYYNRSCFNGFCVGSNSDYCSDGCNADGCIGSTYGCTTPSACNFDATATTFDNSCWSATEGCECSDGEGAVADNCGTCDTDTSNDCIQDCKGVWGGDSQYDECGVCGGDGSLCIDCMVFEWECGNMTIPNGIASDIPTIKIGNQWWTRHNMVEVTYNNGSPISTGHDNLEWTNLDIGGYSVIGYEDSLEPSSHNTNENLYNWYAVNDTRGICPEGWHVPSDDEWKILIDYLGGYDNAGGLMKQVGFQLSDSHNYGTHYWDSPNTGATNSSGFSAKSGGYRDGGSTGEYNNLGTETYFWSSTEENQGAIAYFLSYNSSSIIRYEHGKNHGASIRCLKD